MVCESKDFKYRDYDCKGKELADMFQRMEVYTLVMELNKLSYVNL